MGNILSVESGQQENTYGTCKSILFAMHRPNWVYMNILVHRIEIICQKEHILSILDCHLKKSKGKL